MLSQKSAVFGGGFRFDGPKKPPITWGMGAPFMLSTAGRSWVFVVCLKMDGLWPPKKKDSPFLLENLWRVTALVRIKHHETPIFLLHEQNLPSDWLADDFGFQIATNSRRQQTHHPFLPSPLLLSLGHLNPGWMSTIMLLFSAETGTHIRSRIQPLAVSYLNCLAEFCSPTVRDFDEN